MKKLLIPAILGFMLWSGSAHAQTSCNKTTFAIQSLRVGSVSSGAVTVFNTGDVVCGGYIVSASGTICVNQKGTAGTSSSGDTGCVAANVPFYLAPSSGAVSVNAPSPPATLAGTGYH